MKTYYLTQEGIQADYRKTIQIAFLAGIGGTSILLVAQQGWDNPMSAPWVAGTLAVALLITWIKARHEASMRMEDLQKVYVTITPLGLTYQHRSGIMYSATIQDIARIQQLKNGKVKVHAGKQRFSIPAYVQDKEQFLWELRRLGPIETPTGLLKPHPDALLSLKEESTSD
ncbi:MAG TPA: hypothetical protein DCE41_13675 [Cytophagales bacterium]|nr:hypothetical protein [Cytophagales bacterium]HAA22712.1 hypothetical protein [Cytophagales bacterium]HAP58668.1 hypothetical protein [Cytophagales bacterium]